FARSYRLSSGLGGHIFRTVFLGFVLLIVGYILMFVVAGLLISISPYLEYVAQAAGQALVLPILPLILTVLYYDARIRREGFDIELLGEQVADAGAAPNKPQPA